MTKYSVPLLTTKVNQKQLGTVLTTQLIENNTLAFTTQIGLAHVFLPIRNQKMQPKQKEHSENTQYRRFQQSNLTFKRDVKMC